MIYVNQVDPQLGSWSSMNSNRRSKDRNKAPWTKDIPVISQYHNMPLSAFCSVIWLFFKIVIRIQRNRAFSDGHPWEKLESIPIKSPGTAMSLWASHPGRPILPKKHREIRGQRQNLELHSMIPGIPVGARRPLRRNSSKIAIRNLVSWSRFFAIGMAASWRMTARLPVIEKSTRSVTESWHLNGKKQLHGCSF
jgi:hypothetical protein